MKNILTVSLLLLISVTIFAQSKLSPNTRHLITSMKQTGISGIENKKNSKNHIIRTINKSQYINAYIHLSKECRDYSILQEYGVIINSEFPEIITASIPVNKLEDISNLKEVKYLQVGSPVYQLMDKARVTTLTDKVQTGLELSSPFRGNGVVIGIIDTGFEYGHPNFYSYDKSDLRIKRVWDQNGNQGLPPRPFSYGTEYKTKDAILKAEFDGDETHGSHVTGIAAGADTLNNQFYGIAGDAEIVLVSISSTETDADNVSISDGIKYIYDYATSVGKPCVINMSLGMHTGPHDGTSTFDVLSDAMQGKGRLLVGAAGNEGSDNLHISKTFTEASQDSLSSFISFIQGRAISNIDIWGEKGMKYSIQLLVYDRNKKTTKKYYDILDVSSTYGNEKSYVLKIGTDGADGNLYIATEISPLNNKPHAFISADLNSIQGSYCIGFTIKPLSAGTVHVWADDIFSELTSNGISGYTRGDSQCSVGEIGGTGKRIISTGAYTSKSNYVDINGTNRSTGQPLNRITSFSSLGPTPDGRVKPDITAPGSSIGSSISSNDYRLRSEIIVNKKSENNKTYYYGMMDGTSMSSPCVTGILATWLQANDELTPEDVRNVFQKTSIQDSFTGTLPNTGNNTWGYGKIDAWNGIKECLKMNLQSIKSETIPAIVVTLSENREINLLFTNSFSDANIAVYDLNGKIVYRLNLKNINAGEEMSITPEGINQGIYIMKVLGNQMTYISKLIIK